MSDTSVTRAFDDSGRQQLLESVIADYIRACDAGASPDQRLILEQHPELADDLQGFFAQRDHLKQLAGPIRAFGDSLFQSIGPGKHISYVGDYELLEEVARGGMGVVYKARQKTLGRIVAVKMMLTGLLANDEDVKRFQVEAQAAANLQHPNIVPIHEVGQHEGLHYFSMDFVEGRSLSAVLRENVLPAKQAASYVRQMAEAIHYAHQQGTLHRDLKPSNVLIDSRDQVRITDFGLAMRVEGDSGLTQTGQIVGTPSYMPPEQAQGKRSLIGPGSDVYSLGAILYECLTGRAPFRADSVMKTLEQVIHREAASPRLLNPSVARDLETICLKCLEKEPHRRYGTAQLLADDLGRYLDDRPILARPVGTIERTWRWCRRNPAVVSLLATVALCLIVGTAVSAYFAIEASNRAKAEAFHRGRADDKTTLAEIARKQAEEALKREEVARDQAELARRGEYIGRRRAEDVVFLFEDLVARPEAKYAIQNLVSREFQNKSTFLYHFGHYIQWPANAARDDSDFFVIGVLGTDEFGGFLEALANKTVQSKKVVIHRFLSIQDYKPCHILFVAAVGIPGQPERSEDYLRRILEVVKDSHVLTVGQMERFSQIGGHIEFRVEANRPIRLKINMGAVRRSGLSIDSKLLKLPNVEIVGTEHEMPKLPTVDIVTTEHPGQQTLTLNGHTNGVTSVAFSADGKWLASASLDQTVKVWDATSGKETRTMKGHIGGALSVAFSPDGTRLATAGADRIVKVWDATSGQETLTLKGHTGVVLSAVFSPDGTRLASASGDQRLKVWDATSGRETLALKGHAGFVTSVAFSPDGTRLASASHDRTVKVWDTTSGQETLTLKGHTHGVASVAFSPDGTRLASASYDGTVKVWDASGGQEALTLKGHTHGVASVAFSADGKRLASASYDQTVKVWDATTGQETLTLEGHTSRVTSVAFSPDGKRLASSASRDKSVKVWDTRPWTPELRTEQAASLIRFLLAKPLAKAALLDAITADATISEPVRQRALELAREWPE